MAEHGFSDGALRPAFGMAETSSVITWSSGLFLQTVHEEGIGFVSLGGPIPGAELRIVDEDGSVLQEGAVGFLQLRGPSVMSGYYNNPEANSKSMRPDGWFQTGDTAYLAAGELYITGRSSEVIIVNGLNLSPHEIETAVGEVDGVHKAAVAAFAIRKPGQATDEIVVIFEPEGASPEDIPRMAEIARNVTALIARRQGLRLAFVLPVERGSLPRTSIGKIQRKTLKDAFESGAFDEIKASIAAYFLSSDYSSTLETLDPREGTLANSSDGLEAFLCRTTWLLENHNRQEILQGPVGLILPSGADHDCLLAKELSARLPGSVILLQDERLLPALSTILWLDAAYLDTTPIQDRLSAFRVFFQNLPDFVT
ncbi:MAG: AMP-binding protein, partial [Methylocystis sp.]